MNDVNPELAAVEVSGINRSAFLVRGALATGGLYGAGAVGSFVTRAFAAGGGDVDILNFALTLEYLETAFYEDGLKRAKLSGEAKKQATTFGDQEAEHVDALVATIKKLGGKLPAKPKAKFPLKDQASILKLAATVENLGANAYLGQAANIESPEVLAAALSIHSVEARHAAVLNQVTKQEISPDGAFAKPASADEVLKAVQPFLIS